MCIMYHVKLHYPVKCGSMCRYTNGDRVKATSKRVKLQQVTWCLGDTNTDKYGVLWCNKQKRAKRNKPAKVNGVMYNEIIEVYHQLN